MHEKSVVPQRAKNMGVNFFFPSPFPRCLTGAFHVGVVELCNSWLPVEFMMASNGI